ncbi:hypothetical protein QBC47DRAFT_381510 [Echria macrotheca]|uniref:3-hydroxyacyl-CoA dehydrogenase n=1 Tax=Echria macrotheca TaxID=438768 RepID=A0AAJ0BDH8_9PEZI|nr:hypothetical protein QBC47DRAFT_381510 [Echria macrotheca]
MASSLITVLPPSTSALANTMAGSPALALKLFRGPLTKTKLSVVRVLYPPIRGLVTTSHKTNAPRPSVSLPTPIQQHLPFSTTKPSPFLFASVRDGGSPAPPSSQWTPPSEECLDERPVLIVGAGNLGRRIALVWASSSRPVTIYDASKKSIDEAIEYITDNLGEYCTWRGTPPGHVFGTTDLRVATTTGRYESSLLSETTSEAEHIELVSGAKGPWMAVECISPDILSAKLDMLAQLEDLLPPGCIIASNSSSLSTSEMAPHLRYAANRLLNTHYFIPPRNLMVELMSSTQTDPAIFPFLQRQMRRVGLTPITVPAGIQSTGLIFNRIWAACKRETLAVVSEGVATPADVDALFRDFFHAEKGPCERMDEVGLDVVANVEQHALERRPELGRLHVLRWLERQYLERGRLGEKTGDGLFTEKEREGLKALHKAMRFPEVEETSGA